MGAESRLYLEIADSFTKRLVKDHIMAVILDGSVNNEEEIIGYSDIDMKVIVQGTKVPKEVYNNINLAISCSLKRYDVVFNVWTLLENEYPYKENYSFDFVRRYCLLSGNVLYENNFIQGDKKCVHYITKDQRKACMKAMFNFQIRLRRLLTNPTAISDVNQISAKFILQQSIAYLFHGLRYYNAFNGYLCLTIFQVYHTYLQEEENEIVERAYFIRNHWNTVNFTLAESYDLLYSVTDLLDRLINKMLGELSLGQVKLTYV